jgi:transposase
VADEALIRKKFEALRGSMDERVTRLWAGAEADAIGYGGVLAVARATGLAPNTVKKGRDELRAGAKTDDLVKVRRKGGGGRRHEDVHPELLPTLKKLVDPATRGDPESPLRWTAKSAVVLSSELFHGYGIRVSDKTVGKLLRQLGYSLQAAKKTVEGAQHPDRNAQFEHINAQAKDARARGVPFISVDTKKKELVGNFKNAGVEWQPQDQPELVDVHDFPSAAVGKAIPYGIYDVGDNRGFVNVGTDHDTPVFAVTSIEAWWKRMGIKRYPDATELFHHGRRGWQQRLPVARVEGRTTTPRR